jgi:GH25 family lysozyme M1 (1,4-beta-N-acetylmuramidase)
LTQQNNKEETKKKQNEKDFDELRETGVGTTTTTTPKAKQKDNRFKMYKLLFSSSSSIVPFHFFSNFSFLFPFLAICHPKRID